MVQFLETDLNNLSGKNKQRAFDNYYSQYYGEYEQGQYILNLGQFHYIYPL